MNCLSEQSNAYVNDKILNGDFKIRKTGIACDARCDGCPFDSKRFVCDFDEYMQEEFLLKYYPEHMV